MFFVNLNLRIVRRDPEVLSRFLTRGVNPELGLDPVLMDAVDASWHRELAARLADAGLTTAVHLPFFDLQPGSADELVRTASRERLVRALDVARVYSPAHLVGHARYDALLYARSYAQWLERAVDTWLGVSGSWPEHPPLYLENTFEPDPATVAGVVEALGGHLGGRVGLCLDVGHWFSFSRGVRLDNLERWLDAFGPGLAHLHLHDNDGAADQHLGLGRGAIPWRDVFEGLARRGLCPTATFEPHTDEAYQASMDFARAHPEWFAPLGVAAPPAQI